MIDYRVDPPVIFADDFAERDNIAWRVEPARDRSVLLEPAFPWDGALVCKGHGTVLKDPRDGLFKGWFVSVEEDLAYRRGRQEYRLVYAESRDGWQWERPPLDLCPYPGHRRTNILFDYAAGGRTSYASVLVDDDDVAEPYQMFCFRDPGWKCPGGVPATVCTAIDPPTASTGGRADPPARPAIRRRTLAARARPASSGDTLYVHRDPDGTYVSHHKRSIPNYPGARAPYDVDPEGSRSAYAATSADGAHWQPSTIAMTPDWLDQQGDQIMELGRHPYQGGFVGVTAVYHSRHQEMDLQVAASPDGRPLSWWRPARRPCLPLAALGEYGGGLIWPTRTLVEDGDRWVLFYGATEGLHGDPYARDESVRRRTDLAHAYAGGGWRSLGAVLWRNRGSTRRPVRPRRECPAVSRRLLPGVMAQGPHVGRGAGCRRGTGSKPDHQPGAGGARASTDRERRHQARRSAPLRAVAGWQPGRRLRAC